jgi:glycosyltransferase involved in cell wall biosynthesis
VANSLLGQFGRKAKKSLMSTQKKRILFVISGLNLGGAERQMLLLCQMLETQVDVQIISLELEGPLKEKYSKAFPEMYFLDKKNQLSQIIKVQRIVRIYKPDVVITWLYKADLIGGIASRLAGNFPVVWSARNSALPHFSSFKRVILMLFSRLVPKWIIANGKPAYDFHKSIGYPTKKMQIIPNALAPWTSSAKSKSRLLQKDTSVDKIRIGIAARQVSGKGILEMIEMLKLIPPGFPKIELSLIGQHSIESLKWEENNLYGGHIVQTLNSDSDLAEWFANLDLYVMSSTYWESQPNALIEAIAIGCPFLVSNRIDLDLPIPQQFRFDPKSASSFQKALIEIVRLDSLELAALINSTRIQTLATLSGEVASARWLALINESKVKGQYE